MQNETSSVYKHSSFKGLIGVASLDITPPIGIYFRNWGLSKSDVAEGIHRPMMLSCLTFQSTSGGQPLILISADLGWWRTSEDENEMRTQVLEALSIEASQLMICLSHTHAGPSICRSDAHRPGGQFIGPYLESLKSKSIAAAQEALSNASSATLTWHYGKCDLATNRDLRDQQNDRNIVGFNPDVLADDTLLVGRVCDEAQRIIASIVNYACHPTTLAWDNPLVSPDFIGSMRETIENHTHAPCLFLQGASGDLAPQEQYSGDTELADKHGRQLGFAALSTLAGMLPPETMLDYQGVQESGAPLAIWNRTSSPSQTVLSAELMEVPLVLKPLLPSIGDLQEAWNACDDPVLKERLWRKLCIRRSIGDGNISKMPLWIWRLGDALLIGQPNEAYSDFQQDLRKQLSPTAVGVMNIVNGSFGYLPPSELYDKNAYAVWQSPFAAGSLESLTDVAVKAAQRIMRGE